MKKDQHKKPYQTANYKKSRKGYFVSTLLWWLLCIIVFLWVGYSVFRFLRYQESDISTVIGLVIALIVGFFITDRLRVRLLKTWYLGLSMAVVIGGMLFFSCSNTTLCRFVNSDKVIKIGVTLPLSGDKANDGKPIEEAITLAIKEWTADNAGQPGLFTDGHYPPPVIFAKDYAGDDEEMRGMEDMKLMVNDAQVAGVLGPFDSGVGLKQISLTNYLPGVANDISRKGMPHDMTISLLSPSTTSLCLTKCGNGENGGVVKFFRMSAPSDKQALYFAKWLAENGYAKKRVAILTDNAAYGVDLAKQFEDNWKKYGEIVPINGSSFVNVNVDQRDISSIESDLQSLVIQKPDIVFYSGTTPHIRDVYTRLLTNGEDKTFIKEEFPAFLSQTVVIGGGAVRNNLGTKNLLEDDNFKHFKDIYVVAPVQSGPDIPDYPELSKDGELNLYAHSAYSVTRILLDAIKVVIDEGTEPPGNKDDLVKAKEFRAKVIEKINHTKYAGKPYFDAHGDITNGIVSIHKFNKQFDRYKQNDKKWDFIINY